MKKLLLIVVLIFVFSNKPSEAGKTNFRKGKDSISIYLSQDSTDLSGQVFWRLVNRSNYFGVLATVFEECVMGPRVILLVDGLFP